jgi:hypothetical protein
MELIHQDNPDFDPVLVTPRKSEVQEWARMVCEDPKVRHIILVEARKGRLNPKMMALLFAYAYGKPSEQLIVSNGEQGTPFTLNLIQYVGEGGK